MSAVMKTELARKELLLGSGPNAHDRPNKIVTWGDRIPETWSNLVTLDMEAAHKPDVVHDLNVLPYPFADNEFDEIHAYEVLEHCGRQGDYKFFFAQFTEFWRILKPDGYLCGSCPMWDQAWAWGDPGHTRVLSHEALSFLEQKFYDQIGKSAATDYRSVYKADFEYVDYQERGAQFFFALRAIK